MHVGKLPNRLEIDKKENNYIIFIPNHIRIVNRKIKEPSKKACCFFNSDLVE